MNVTVDAVLDGIGKRIHKVSVLSPENTLGEILKTLGERHILSAPVVSGHREFQGIIDLHDILNVVVDVYQQHGPQWDKLAAVFGQRLQSVIKHIHQSEGRDISFLAAGLGTAHRLRDVVHKNFIEANTHRVAINDCDGMVFEILSQTDIVRWVSKHGCGEVSKLTLEQLGLDRKKVWTVSQSEKAIDAFVLMKSNKVRVLAVLNASNEFAGVISTSALRGLGTADLPLLGQSVSEFLAANKTYDRASAPASPTSPLQCRPTDTFGDVLQKIAQGNAHEIVVVGEHKEVLSIVTLTDVLRTLFS
eukprot:TRINITY_DN81903_c0_g1_i1.p1 TRINITY_DN81903_c0_g1~~TRINITY_DN81903_c0_g1_i1.p1  ORF type:complete len:315 (+),score=61.39 TRINITY_DN81903_c0_g1_i1:34-945(+)